MQQEANKKRKIGEISNEGTTSTAKFTYKFKEGHSKNFKRELTFDYFLTWVDYPAFFNRFIIWW